MLSKDIPKAEWYVYLKDTETIVFQIEAPMTNPNFPECLCEIPMAKMRKVPELKHAREVIALLPRDIQNFYDMDSLSVSMVQDLPMFVREFDAKICEKGVRLLTSCREWFSGYFDNKYPSRAADNLMKFMKFKSIAGRGESIDKAILYYYKDVYLESGSQAVSSMLEKIREAMEERFSFILKKYVGIIVGIAMSLGEKAPIPGKKLYASIKPLDLELRQSFRDEILNSIKARSLTPLSSMNPNTHLPLWNGLLNLRTWELEPFSPSLFFTYQVQGNYLGSHVTLHDVPLFAKYLNDVYQPLDIPLVLSYLSYSLYPGFPVHKVLFIIGRERIGKGTTARLMKGILDSGYGSVELSKLLQADRFQFTGILGKNLLVDPEIKRVYRKGMHTDYRNFNSLFGQDILQFEPKGREARDAISSAKGIFIGNLPIMVIDNPAALARTIVIETNSERDGGVIPDLDKKMLEGERDEIITLLLQVLKSLSLGGFKFPHEKSYDETADLMEKLSDPVGYFIDEATSISPGSEIEVTAAYDLFSEWCKIKGIPVITKQTFTKRFGSIYPKKKLGPKTKRVYKFTDCEIQISDDFDDSKEVGHRLESENPLNSAVSGAIDNGVQLRYTTPPMTRPKSKDDLYIRDSVPKLDTDKNDSQTSVEQPPGEHQLVSNFNIDEAKALLKLRELPFTHDSVNGTLKVFLPRSMDIVQGLERNMLDRGWKVVAIENDGHGFVRVFGKEEVK